MRGRKKNLFNLKIKRAAFFGLALGFFLLPGQNWYSAVALKYQTPKAQPLTVTSPIADYPVFIGPKTPQVTARSAVVLDRDSAVLMYGKNDDVRLLPASTVKIMTALVALENYGLDDVLTVKEIAHQGQQSMNLVKGERMTVANLLYGLLVASANDAAMVLAQDYPGGNQAFVAAMNQKAQNLNLLSTHFANPTGLDSDEKGKLLADYSYTTALDLSRLAAVALKNKTIDQIVATQKISVTDVSGKIVHNLYSINTLLGKVEGLKGLKTGWTEEAGECLVGYAERDGRGIISVVLGSQDRFGETAELINWAFSAHRWEATAPPIYDQWPVRSR